MQAYGNLFQGRQTVEYTTGRHAFKAGFEARINRDTTYFGISPNGEYDFGGGTAYATEAIPSASGMHNVAPGDRAAGYALGIPFGQSVCVYGGHCAALHFGRASILGPRPSIARATAFGRRIRGK